MSAPAGEQAERAEWVGNRVAQSASLGPFARCNASNVPCFTEPPDGQTLTRFAALDPAMRLRSR